MMSGLTKGIRELHIGTESAEEEGVHIGVRDTGPGLSAENLQHLFEPFYTTKPNGMGNHRPSALQGRFAPDRDPNARDTAINRDI